LKNCAPFFIFEKNYFWLRKKLFKIEKRFSVPRKKFLFLKNIFNF